MSGGRHSDTRPYQVKTTDSVLSPLNFIRSLLKPVTGGLQLLYIGIEGERSRSINVSVMYGS